MLKNISILPVTFVLLVTIQSSSATDITPIQMSLQYNTQRIYFPPPGEGLDKQDRRKPKEVGLNHSVIKQLKDKASRWALWRNGYLVHVEGDFNKKTDVASLRKTWHALTVGAAIKQGKIPSYHQKISKWNRELTGNDAEATWWHVITQSAGFDYPYDDYPDYKPGKIWTYTDHNPYHLCHALARAYGKKNYYDNYSDVVARAYFNDIGMRGWKTSVRKDGIRFHFDLEDMGRLGLLVLARGKWKGKEVIPQLFVEELETKQTYGMLVNYDGPYDGKIDLDPTVYPECPYGYMTWVNTDQDLYPGADVTWANGAGAGGTYILWNHRNGIVFAGVAVKTGPTSNGIPHIIERNITESNPLIAKYRGNIGTFSKWAKIEFEMIGPDSQGAGNPNPFDILVDVTFTGPSEQTYVVPGFYDGNGNGSTDGDVWKVRFSADQIGTWTFTSSSPNSQLDGYTGSFDVVRPPASSSDFYKWGRLESVGTPENKIRYLKFRDGPYWLKAGCDDPENFLGSYANYNTTAKRKVAIDYLAGRGINSLYIMTHNVGGDDRDVWPWLGETPRQAMANSRRNVRFDVAKLAQWRDLFEYMQSKGVVPYLVLEDDSAWKGYDHARYYREIIARFGDLPALLFNFGEEHNENYCLSQALEFMLKLKQIDPYDHPRGIHNVNTPNDQYVNASQVDFTSIQTGSVGVLSGFDKALEHHRTTIDWIERCRQRGKRILVVNFDEGRPEEDRHAWWSAYIAGGVWEAHVLKSYDRPMSAWEPVWTQLGGARTFMESLPFWEMESHDELINSGTAFCLAKHGEVYALYLPSGGEVTVNLPPNRSFESAWWNPANGQDGHFQNRARVNGGTHRFVAPTDGDWALRITQRER
ncbi:MAG: DUF5060 domain-containing protein [Planctomycetes bacterium]|nr:DUF5060 domain-containing protein [Planctomycetota bacterium]